MSGISVQLTLYWPIQQICYVSVFTILLDLHIIFRSIANIFIFITFVIEIFCLAIAKIAMRCNFQLAWSPLFYACWVRWDSDVLPLDFVSFRCGSTGNVAKSFFYLASHPLAYRGGSHCAMPPSDSKKRKNLKQRWFFASFRGSPWISIFLWKTTRHSDHLLVEIWTGLSG